MKKRGETRRGLLRGTLCWSRGSIEKNGKGGGGKSGAKRGVNGCGGGSWGVGGCLKNCRHKNGNYCPAWRSQERLSAKIRKSGNANESGDGTSAGGGDAECA